jgi:hypothetical protein
MFTTLTIEQWILVIGFVATVAAQAAAASAGWKDLITPSGVLFLVTQLGIVLRAIHTNTTRDPRSSGRATDRPPADGGGLT